MMNPSPSYGVHPDALDVTISIGFLRGIFMHEANKMKDWQHHAEFDSMKVVIIARNDSKMVQADGFITSSPLDKPKPVGDWMNFTALFPLKGSSPPSKMTLSGLIQRDHSSQEYSSHGQYTRESIELLITLIFGNEAITVGKARLLVTGEETRTKQSDLPIDITRDGIIKSQKKSQFPMKRMSSLPGGKRGELAPVSFKYDRRRRKFQIETDAVLRVFYKVSPHDPFSMNNNHVIPNVSSNLSGQGIFSSMSKSKLFGGGISRSNSSVGPRGGRVDVPSTVGGFSEGPRGRNRPPSQMGRPPSSSSQMGGYGGIPASMSMSGNSRQGYSQQQLIPQNRMPSPMPMQRMPSTRSDNSNPRSMGGSYYGGASPGRTGPPMSVNGRAQSAPRMRYPAGGGFNDQQSVYGGSTYGYGGGGSNLSRHGGSRRGNGNPSVNGGGQQQYGGSSYGGAPRKMHLDKDMTRGRGFNNQGYGGHSGHITRSRSQSPYTPRI